MFKLLEGSVLDSEEKYILTLSKKSCPVELQTLCICGTVALESAVLDILSFFS